MTPDNERKEMEKILTQYTPHETTGTRLSGGIVDWSMTFTKDGLNSLLDQLEAFVAQREREARLEELKQIAIKTDILSRAGYIADRILELERLAQLSSGGKKTEERTNG